MALVTITALVGEPLGALAAHGRPASSFSVGENANSVYSASKDPVEITGPINITKPGYYVIASNISVCSDNYTIGVFASNVIINGEGHVITGCRVIIGVGVVESVGILINNASNVTIEDLVVRKYYYVVNGSGNDIRVINASLEKGLTADLQLWGNNISIYNAFVPSSGRGINITGNNITIYKVNTFGDYIGVAVNGNQVKLERVTNPDNSYGIVVNGDYVTVIGGASSSRFGATFNGSHISVVNSTFNVESGLYGKSYGVGVRGSYVTMLNVTAGSGQVGVEVNGSYVNLSDIEANGDSIGILINGSHVNVDSVTIYTARVGVEAFGSHIRLSGLSLSYNVVYNGTGATGLLVKGETINMSEVREAGYTYDINSTGTNITISDSELLVTGRSGLGINVTGSGVSLVYVNVSSFAYGVYVKGPNATIYGSDIQAANYTLYLYDSYNDLIYNNVFDGPVKVVNSTATWYVTPRPGTNVLGGKVIAGNAWLLPNGSGFSQVTPSSPSDPYICDEPYEVAPGQYDMNPLKYPQPSNASTVTQTTTYSTTTTTTSTTTVSETTSTTVTTTTQQAESQTLTGTSTSSTSTSTLPTNTVSPRAHSSPTTIYVAVGAVIAVIAAASAVVLIRRR